jgi:hypothetical protein
LPIAEANVISEKEAKSLINKHIQFNPSIEIRIGDLYILDMLPSGKNIINYYKKLDKIGVIDLQEEKRAYDSTRLNISLARKAKSYEYFFHEYNENLIALSDGIARVNKIIKIDNENNVLFKFIYSPVDLFKSEFGLMKSQFYGKAFISYDSFKEKYVFNGYVYKDEIAGEYKKDNWTYKKNEQQVYSNEIKGLENLLR